MTTIEDSQRLKSAFLITAVIAAVAVATTQQMAPRVETTVSQRTLFSSTCSIRDVQLVTLIEERGNAQEVAGHKLFEATLNMMQARQACAEGRESEALEI